MDRVMSCVSTPSFSVRINGKAYGNITPPRGIRQGDPLSPYLFLICAEGFTSLLDRVEIEGRLHGVALCRSAPSITNLHFANDSLIFVKLIKMKYRWFLIPYNYIWKLQGNALILRSPLLILVVMCLWSIEHG